MLVDNKHILYVEDDPSIQVVVQTSLELFSTFKVVTAYSQNAMALACSQTWDVIILEVAKARGIDLTLVQQLRSHPKTRCVPIIVLTSRVMPDEILLLNQLNIAGVISKPFDPVALGQQVSDILNYGVGYTG